MFKISLYYILHIEDNNLLKFSFFNNILVGDAYGNIRLVENS